jgi:hypothetical protein
MFTKISIALATLVVIASGAIAAERPQHGVASSPQITLPSTTPEGNRAGWFMDR